MSAYIDIERQLKNNNSLLSSIQSLHSSLAPSRKLRTHKLNDQQILTQIYNHVKTNMTKLKEIINENISDEQIENQQYQEGEEQYLQDDAQQHYQQEQYDQQANEIQQQVEDYEDQEENKQEVSYEDQNQQEQQGPDEFDHVSEDDIGLYGQEIDEEDMQSYENQNMQDDPQFEKNFNQQYNDQQQEDDLQNQQIEENFDHFRDVQRQNQNNDNRNRQTNKSNLEHQIDKLQQKVFNKKEWTLMGEVKAKQRPVNSLLQQNLQFKSGIKLTEDLTQTYNQDLQQIIKQRILDQLFDDRVRYVSSMAFQENFGKKPLQNVSTQKSKKGLSELYEAQFKNYLGLGQNKDNKLKQQIMQGFKQLNYNLDSLSNLNFIPKNKNNSNSSGKQVSIVMEEKVPITNWTMQDNDTISKKIGKSDLQGQKQVDKKSKRLKNKRISRQRKKEQMRKHLNKKIQYGGLTKVEALARKKIKINQQIKKGTNVKTHNKFNKSNEFFKKMNDRSLKPGKPNANLSKMKI